MTHGSISRRVRWCPRPHADFRCRDAQTYSAPKTPWGDPDLQGIWSGDSAFGIPLQRPEALGTKAELTDKEFAEKVARDERTRKRASTPSARSATTTPGSRESFRQTSLIIDPPERPRAGARARSREAPDAARARTATVRSTHPKTSPPTTAASRWAWSAR